MSDGLVLQDLANGGEQIVWPANVEALLFSPDSRWLLAQAGSEMCLIYVPERNARVLPAPANARLLAFSPQGTYFAFADQAAVRVYRTSKVESAFDVPYQTPVHTLSFSEDESTIAFAGNDGVVHVRQGNEVWSFRGHTDPVRFLA